MKRSVAYYRWQRKQAIKRKLGILRRRGGQDFVNAWTHGADGRLAKGKLHCSCPLCRRKSCEERRHTDKKALISVRRSATGRMV